MSFSLKGYAFDNNDSLIAVKPVEPRNATKIASYFIKGIDNIERLVDRRFY